MSYKTRQRENRMQQVLNETLKLAHSFRHNTTRRTHQIAENHSNEIYWMKSNNDLANKTKW